MYNDLIISHFSNPQHSGELAACDYDYEIGNPVCGDRIHIQLQTNDTQQGKQIEKAVFRAWGCATSLATANIFCESIINTSIACIAQRDEQQMEQMLGDLEPSQQHCLPILVGLHEKLLATLTPEVTAS